MLEDPSFWWSEDVASDDRHEHVLRYVRALEDSQRELHEKYVRNAWLYDNARLMGINGDVVIIPSHDQGPVTENIVESIIDTATALIAKQRPRATFMTDGAEFKTQRRARMLEKFVEGEFHRLSIYDVAVRMFRDACVFGTGILKFYEHEGKVAIDRVLTDELLADEEECRSSATPRQLHQRKFVDRNVLKAFYPEFAEQIDRANRGDNRYWTSYRKLPHNQIPVVESWHLRSSRKSDDGKHSIVIEGATLLDEPWEKDHFPFVVYRWSERITGFYGRGLAEQLAGKQLRINKHNRFIAKCQDLVAVPRTYVNVADAGLKVRFTNEVGQVIPYRKERPVTDTPPAVSPEIYQNKRELKDSAFQDAGISQLSAQSKKPVGLESAVALREYNDIETQRFSIQSQRYEKVFLDAARHIVEIAQEIYADSGNYKTVWRSRSLIQQIDWSDVDLEEDMYSISVEASSILSRTPAGRLQAVIELAQSGLINQDTARRLLGHPDLERAMSLDNAAIEDIEATIEELLDGKDFRPPEPFQNLPLALTMMQFAYLKARRDCAPEDVMEDMRRWMELAQNLMQQQASPAPMGAGMGAPPPQAALSAQAQQLMPQ